MTPSVRSSQSLGVKNTGNPSRSAYCKARRNTNEEDMGRPPSLNPFSPSLTPTQQVLRPSNFWSMNPNNDIARNIELNVRQIRDNSRIVHTGVPNGPNTISV